MLSIEKIKLFLNDFPEANRLLKKCEFSPERIKAAITHVVSEFNETPPIIGNYSIDNFPYDVTLLYGVCSYLLSSEAISQERNHLSYSSGGLSVDDSNHTGAYLSLANNFQSKFKDLMERQKKVENWDSAWGTINSGYY